MDRAGLVVGARQVAGAHEEFADDLAAHELEGLAEQLHPLVLAERMVRVDPAAEGAVVAAQGDDALCILDGGVDLQAVADDAGVRQQPRALADAVAGHLRSEEHTSALQSTMRPSYAVLCLKKTKKHTTYHS